MELAHTIDNGVLTITPQGKNLDAKEAPSFKQQAIEIIDDTKVYQVVFDLQRVQFMDSSGLGCFLSVLRFLNLHGGQLKLASMNRSLKTLFELVSMHKIFNIFPSAEEAVTSFHDYTTM